MTKLLSAPCVFCGYTGVDYWQSETHSPDCPWYDVAGKEARKEAIRGIIDRIVYQLQADWKTIKSLNKRVMGNWSG